MANLITDLLATHHQSNAFQLSSLKNVSENHTHYFNNKTSFLCSVSSCLKTKTSQTNLKMLLCFCKFLGFHLSQAPSSSNFSRGTCASSQPCHALRKHRGSDTITPLKLLVLRQSLLPLHSLPSGIATADHFLVGQSPLLCLASIICLAMSQAPLQFSAVFQEILAFLRGRNPS